MRLDVGVGAAEQGLGPVDGQALGGVDVSTARAVADVLATKAARAATRERVASLLLANGFLLWIPVP